MSAFSFHRMWYWLKSRRRRHGGVESLTGRKNGFAQICSLRVCRKNVKPKSKYGETMVNVTFAYQTTGNANIQANVTFSIFATDLLLSFFCYDIFAGSKFFQIQFFVQYFCVERFFSGFPLSLKTNIASCNLTENGRRRTILWMCYF